MDMTLAFVSWSFSCSVSCFFGCSVSWFVSWFTLQAPRAKTATPTWLAEVVYEPTPFVVAETIYFFFLFSLEHMCIIHLRMYPRDQLSNDWIWPQWNDIDKIERLYVDTIIIWPFWYEFSNNFDTQCDFWKKFVTEKLVLWNHSHL